MILEYDLQFFAAEGQGGEKTELLPRKSCLMPEKKVRLPKAVRLQRAGSADGISGIENMGWTHGVSVYKCVQRHLRENSRGGDFLAR